MEKRANPAKAFFRNNPVNYGVLDDLIPGFAAYAGTRMASRIATVSIGKRWPGLGKHAGAAAAALSALGVWFLGNKVVQVEKWHRGITTGAAIAALQTLAQTYLPAQYAWVVSDCDPSQYMPAAPILQPVAAPAATGDSDEYGDLDEGYITDEEEAAAAPPVSNEADNDQGEPTDADGDDEDFGGGIFGSEGE